MKKTVYSLINKLGYRIEKKKRNKREIAPYLNKFNVLENFDLLFHSKEYVLNLDKKFKNFAITNHKEGFLVSFLDFNIYLESDEEFHILNEIFVRNDYDFISSSKAILIDIGSNIGITSLFFSQFDYYILISFSVVSLQAGFLPVFFSWLVVYLSMAFSQKSVTIN